MRRTVRYTRTRKTWAYAASDDAGDMTGTSATETIDSYPAQLASQRERDMIGASVGQMVWKIPFASDEDIQRDDELTAAGITYKVDQFIPERRRGLRWAFCTSLDR